MSSLNPRWSDEVIFLETQRIVIAELQHIVYNEWLPQVIGTETMLRFSLNIHESGYSTDYNPDVNACITSEFSTAAQRFGHSTVDGKLLYVAYLFRFLLFKHFLFFSIFFFHFVFLPLSFSMNGFFPIRIFSIYSVHRGDDVDEAIEIPDVMFNTGRLRQRHFYDEILLTLTRQPLQQVDSAVTQGVSSHLITFQTGNEIKTN